MLPDFMKICILHAFISCVTGANTAKEASVDVKGNYEKGSEKMNKRVGSETVGASTSGTVSEKNPFYDLVFIYMHKEPDLNAVYHECVSCGTSWTKSEGRWLKLSKADTKPSPPKTDTRPSEASRRMPFLRAGEPPSKILKTGESSHLLSQPGPSSKDSPVASKDSPVTSKDSPVTSKDSPVTSKDSPVTKVSRRGMIPFDLRPDPSNSDSDNHVICVSCLLDWTKKNQKKSIFDYRCSEPCKQVINFLNLITFIKGVVWRDWKMELPDSEHQQLVQHLLLQFMSGSGCTIETILYAMTSRSISEYKKLLDYLRRLNEKVPDSVNIRRKIKRLRYRIRVILAYFKSYLVDDEYNEFESGTESDSNESDTESDEEMDYAEDADYLEKNWELPEDDEGEGEPSTKRPGSHKRKKPRGGAQEEAVERKPQEEAVEKKPFIKWHWFDDARGANETTEGTRTEGSVADEIEVSVKGLFAESLNLKTAKLDLEDARRQFRYIEYVRETWDQSSLCSSKRAVLNVKLYHIFNTRGLNEKTIIYYLLPYYLKIGGFGRNNLSFRIVTDHWFSPSVSFVMPSLASRILKALIDFEYLPKSAVKNFIETNVTNSMKFPIHRLLRLMNECAEKVVAKEREMREIEMKEIEEMKEEERREEREEGELSSSSENEESRENVLQRTRNELRKIRNELGDESRNRRREISKKKASYEASLKVFLFIFEHCFKLDGFKKHNLLSDFMMIHDLIEKYKNNQAMANFLRTVKQTLIRNETDTVSFSNTLISEMKRTGGKRSGRAGELQERTGESQQAPKEIQYETLAGPLEVFTAQTQEIGNFEYLKAAIKDNFEFYKEWCNECNTIDMEALYLPEMVEFDLINANSNPIFLECIDKDLKLFITYTSTIVRYLLRRFVNFQGMLARLQGSSTMQDAIAQESSTGAKEALMRQGILQQTLFDDGKFIAMLVMAKSVFQIGEQRFGCNLFSYFIKNPELYLIYGFLKYLNDQLEKIHFQGNQQLMNFLIPCATIKPEYYVQVLKHLSHQRNSTGIQTYRKEVDLALDHMLGYLSNSQSSAVPAPGNTLLTQVIRSFFKNRFSIIKSYGRYLGNNTRFIPMLKKLYFEYKYGCIKETIGKGAGQDVHNINTVTGSSTDLHNASTVPESSIGLHNATTAPGGSLHMRHNIHAVPGGSGSAVFSTGISAQETKLFCIDENNEIDNEKAHNQKIYEAFQEEFNNLMRTWLAAKYEINNDWRRFDATVYVALDDLVQRLMRELTESAVVHLAEKTANNPLLVDEAIKDRHDLELFIFSKLLDNFQWD